MWATISEGINIEESIAMINMGSNVVGSNINGMTWQPMIIAIIVIQIQWSIFER